MKSPTIKSSHSSRLKINHEFWWLRNGLPLLGVFGSGRQNKTFGFQTRRFSSAVALNTYLGKILHYNMIYVKMMSSIIFFQFFS